MKLTLQKFGWLTYLIEIFVAVVVFNPFTSDSFGEKLRKRMQNTSGPFCAKWTNIPNYLPFDHTLFAFGGGLFSGNSSSISLRFQHKGVVFVKNVAYQRGIFQQIKFSIFLGYHKSIGKVHKCLFDCISNPLKKKLFMCFLCTPPLRKFASFRPLYPSEFL